MDELMSRSFRRSISFSSSSSSNNNNNTSNNTSGLLSTYSRSFMAYHKLSHDSESSNNYDRLTTTNGAWAFVTRIFSFKKPRTDSSNRSAERSSSWRPDPNHRWPVQGW
ncbi:hypothetical protein L6452_10381 [Arctium lappa]|uniref:Uncharacterized protein n=1 Tax=Arctium lappa TaxID=4217 RepID=A0ACB9DMN6_ARCLA|nr:hypothetical protein L6452_10381 [Arctium lappa]